MNRRSFLTGLTCLVAAPSIVRASSIMPVSVLEPGIENTVYVYSVRANRWERMAMSEFLSLPGAGDAYDISPLMAVRHVFGPPVNVAIFPENWRK